MWRNVYTCSFLGVLFLLNINCADAVVGQVCPLNYVVYAQSCYRFMWTNPKNWWDARNWCKAQGGNLLKVETLQEWTWVSKYMNSLHTRQHAPATWWTGLNDNNANSAWQWGDNSPVDERVIIWQRGAPNNAGNREHCVRVENMKLNDRPCSEKIAYVCERARGIPLTCDRDHGWQSYPPYCYKVHTDNQNWNRARSACIHGGGDLVTITSATDENVMQGLAKTSKKPFWIGLQSTLSGTSVTWTWTNGTTLSPSLAYWNNRRPPFIPQNRRNSSCVYVSNSINNLYAWQTMSCSSRRSYVCRKPEGVCQSGWVAHQRHCYQFNIRFKYTWQQSKSFCDRQNTKLVEIYQYTDQQFIQGYLTELREAGINDFWIGATDNNKTAYVWSHNGPIRFTSSWSHRPPSNTQNKPDCVYIATGDRLGRWRNTANCIARKAFVCMSNMNQPIKAIPTPRPQYTCDPHWILHGAFCYQFNDTHKSWFDSSSVCAADDPKGQLAKVTSGDIQAFINSHTHNQEYWIGLNDQASEHHFVWADNSRVTYTKWNPHEPNNQMGENCVETRNHGWNDKDCSTHLKFICQKPARNLQLPVGPVKTTNVPYNLKCGELWEDDPNTEYCYQFHDQQLDWEDARATCQQQGGDLLSIGSREEQFYVAGKVSLLSSIGVWIGANDRAREGQWTWTDRTPFAYFNWAAGEPNDFHHNEDCVMMFTQKSTWNDAGCTNRNGFVCKKLGFITTTAQATTTRHVPAGKVLGCPAGWKKHDNSCYQFVKQTVTWSQGRSLCRTRGSYMASIGSQNEQNYVMSQLPRSGYGFWIGLNDLDTEMKFQWTDGSRVTYTHWGPGEPNNYRGHQEDCVQIYLRVGTWNDNICSSRSQGVICERPLQIVSATQSQSSVGCPASSTGFQASCYYLETRQNKRWQDANNDCAHRFHGKLATINDRFTQAFVSSSLEHKSDYFWIGMSDMTTPGTYRWASGTPVGFTFWDSSHTGNEHGTCVAMTTSSPVGLWKNRGCRESHHYICEFHRTGFTTPPTPTPPPSPCPQGWTESAPGSAYCYKVYYNDPVVGKQTWMQAKDYCRALGGDLPSVHDNVTEAFLETTLLGNSSYSGGFWIGLNDRATEAGYVWSDGSGTDYTHWNYGEPNDYNKNEDCVQIVTYTHKWNDNNCYSSTNFVCQIKRGVVPSTTAALPTVSQNPACGSWLSYGNSCYMLSPVSGTSSLISWHDANTYCIGMGATLASIHSLQETNFLVSLTSKRSISSFWVGLNMLATKTYSWYDQSPVDFDFWRTGEPNNFHGAELCVNFEALGGAWNDENCNNDHGFICKKAIGQPAPTPAPTAMIQGGCTNGFVAAPMSNKCFKLGGTTNGSQLTFLQARAACKHYGTAYDLASINSMADQAFVNTLLKGVNYWVWIGLNNLLHQKHFVWSDNSYFHFTNWSPGEPNGHSTDANLQGVNHVEKCGMLFNMMHMVGLWNDQSCDSTLAYLCQGQRVRNTPIQSKQGSCRSGYTSYDTSCYMKFTSPAKSWTDANAACLGQGGTLVNVNDVYEYYFLLSMFPTDSLWIGLQFSQQHNRFMWTQNWPVTYTRWGTGEPTQGANDLCVYTQSGYWNDTDCSQPMAYVCEINSVAPPPATTPYPGHCEDSSQVLYRDNCYFFDPYHLMSWPEAGYMCSKRGMTLVSIHSQDELSFVWNSAYNAKFPANDSTAQAGFNGKPNSVWLGLSRGTAAGFAWTDSTPLDFLSWNKGEPSDTTGALSEECVQMYMFKNTSNWNDINCFNKYGYVCKVKAAGPTTPVPTLAGTNAPATQPRINQPSTHQPSVVTQNPFPTFNLPKSGQVLTGNPIVTPLPTVHTNPQIITYTPRPLHGNAQPLKKAAPGTADKGLSGGAVAGIIIGVLAILGIVAVVLLVMKRKGVGFVSRPANGFDNAVYLKTEQSVQISDNVNNGYMSGIPGEDND